MCYHLFQKDDTEDLIRLDSSSDIDDFDPLKSNGALPLTISNPLYTYENHEVGQSRMPASRPATSSRNDQALLQEYGLDFKEFTSQTSDFDFFGNGNAGKISSKSQWTKFDWESSLCILLHEFRMVVILGFLYL